MDCAITLNYDFIPAVYEQSEIHQSIADLRLQDLKRITHGDPGLIIVGFTPDSSHLTPVLYVVQENQSDYFANFAETEMPDLNIVGAAKFYLTEFTRLEPPKF